MDDICRFHRILGKALFQTTLQNKQTSRINFCENVLRKYFYENHNEDCVAYKVKLFLLPPTLKTVISKLSRFARQLYQKDIYQFNTSAITCYISYYESWIDESIVPEICFCTAAPDSANLIAYMKSKRASAPAPALAHTLVWQ